MTSSEKPMIMNRSEALDRMGGDEELYGEVLDVFFEDVPTQIALLFSSLETGDFITAERQAHSLKSAAGSVGADEMREICLRAEQAFRLREAPGGELRQLSLGIRDAFERVLEWCGRPQAGK